METFKTEFQSGIKLMTDSISSLFDSSYIEFIFGFLGWTCGMLLIPLLLLGIIIIIIYKKYKVKV